MRARHVVGAAAASLPWLVGVAVLLAWVRCGDEAATPAAGLRVAPLEAPATVLGPPPEEGGCFMASPQVVGSGAGWLVVWQDSFYWYRGVRLAPDGTPNDPAPGLLLDPGPVPPYGDRCAAAATEGRWIVACQRSIGVMGPKDAPGFLAAPWPPDQTPLTAVGGHGLALVQAGAWWGISPDGEVLWQVDLPRLGFGRGAATPEGFLLGGSNGVVQPVDPDGQPGEPVDITTDYLAGLAAGPGGVLAWIASAPPVVMLLDAETGQPTGASTEVPRARSLVALPDGWLLENGAEGWHIDADLELTPMALPFAPDWDEWAYDGTEGRLMQAALYACPDSVWAGLVWDGTAEHVGLATSPRHQSPQALGVAEERRVVLEIAQGAPPLLQAWRVDAGGRLLDEAALALPPPLDSPTSWAPTSMAGDGAPWLVAVGEHRAVRLVELDADGGVAARGTLPCRLGPETANWTRVYPAVVQLPDGWLVACLDNRITSALDGQILEWAVRAGVHRLDSAFQPLWDEPRLVSQWTAGPIGERSLVGALADGQVVLGWAEGDDRDPTLRLLQVDPESGAVTDERAVQGVGRPFGLEVRGSDIALLGKSPDLVGVAGALLEGFDDPEPTRLVYPVGPQHRATSGPAFVGDQLWACSTWGDDEVLLNLVCSRLDPYGAGPLDEVLVSDRGRVGAVAGSEEALSVAYTAAIGGTFRTALATLSVEGGGGGEIDGGDGDAGIDGGSPPDAGDGGSVPPPSTDAGDGDGSEPDAGDAGDGDAGEPDAGDAGGGDAGEPDAGDAGGADAGEPDGGDAATPEDEGGCDGCTAGGGGPLGFLALLALGLRRRRAGVQGL